MASRARGIVPTMDTSNTPPPLPVLPAKVARLIDLLVIHCAATPSGQWLGGRAPGAPGYVAAPVVIDGWHAQRGFHRTDAARWALNGSLRAIGYHFVIDLDGHVWTGRALDEVGAHVAGFNANSVGICMVGGVEPQGGRYTAQQWQALAALVRQLAERLGIPLTAPKRAPLKTAPGFQAHGGVCGHRDLSPDLNGDGVIQSREWLKTCPGFDVNAWLRAELKAPADQVAVLP